MYVCDAAKARCEPELAPLRGERKVDCEDYHIASLTGLRGVAAVHVLLFHCSAYFANDITHVPIIVDNGPCSVTLFYVLSGFLLSVVASREDHPTISRATFYAKRFVRLAPLYWLGLLVYACNPDCMRAFARGSDGINTSLSYRPWEVALAVFLTPFAAQTWVPFVQCWMLWNGPSWSVSNEVLFYILFPALYPTVVRWSAWCHHALPALVLVQTACAVGYAAADVALSRALDMARPSRSLDLDVYATPYIRLIDFVIGALVGARFMAVHRAAPPPRWAADVAVAACVALVSTVAVFCDGGHAPRTRRMQAAGVASFVMQGPAFAAAIYCLAFEQRNAACRLLASAPLVVLGRWSYAIYLLHLPLLGWYSSMLQRAHGGSGGSGGSDDAASMYCVARGPKRLLCEGGLSTPHLALSCTLVVACSAAVHLSFEKPLYRWLRGRLVRPATVVQGLLLRMVAVESA